MRFRLFAVWAPLFITPERFKWALLGLERFREEKQRLQRFPCIFAPSTSLPDAAPSLTPRRLPRRRRRDDADDRCRGCCLAEPPDSGRVFSHVNVDRRSCACTRRCRYRDSRGRRVDHHDYLWATGRSTRLPAAGSRGSKYPAAAGERCWHCRRHLLHRRGAQLLLDCTTDRLLFLARVDRRVAATAAAAARCERCHARAACEYPHQHVPRTRLPRSRTAAQPHSRAAAQPRSHTLGAQCAAACRTQDGVEGKARVLGLLLSYVVLLKALFPLRLGSTLLLTPQMQRLLSGGGSVLGGLGLGGRTQPLKSELLSLAAVSRRGLVALSTEEQARFDEIVAELRELSSVERPASDPRLTGAWECQWTSEKEVSFAPSQGASPKSLPDLKLTLGLSVGLPLTLTLALTLI